MHGVGYIFQLSYAEYKNLCVSLKFSRRRFLCKMSCPSCAELDQNQLCTLAGELQFYRTDYHQVALNLLAHCYTNNISNVVHERVGSSTPWRCIRTLHNSFYIHKDRSLAYGFEPSQSNIEDVHFISCRCLVRFDACCR